MKPEQAAPPGSPVLPRGRAGSWPPRVRHAARHPQNTFGSVPLGWHCLLTPALSGTLFTGRGLRHAPSGQAPGGGSVQSRGNLTYNPI